MDEPSPGIKRTSTATATGSTNTFKKTVSTKPLATASTNRPASVTERLSRPSISSTARISSSTTAPTNSSLNRPPTRTSNLTATTTSARRPLTGTTNATPRPTVHRSQPSTASNDSKATDRATDDESKKESTGAIAKPKRMSVAASAADRLASTRSVAPATTSSERISSTRHTAPAPVRRTSTATSTSTLRAGATSPAVSRTSVKSPTKPTSTSSLRTKSAISTSKPSATTTTDRKRLSTIQASSAVRSVKKAQDDFPSESERSFTRTSRNVRPTLGSRKSTHSVLIEQQIREFELVNQMLQQALDVEGRDPTEQANLESEAAETMSKLRSTLGRVRKFEKQHGRVPSEDELAEVSSVDMEPLDVAPGFDPNESMISATASAAGDHAHTLREELNESRAYTSQLEQQISDLNVTLKEYEDNLPTHGADKNGSTEQAQAEHAQAVRNMSSANQARLDHLRSIHHEELRELREQHEQDIAALRRDQESDLSSKEDAIQRMDDKVKELTKQLKTSATDQENHGTASQKRVQDLSEQLENLTKQMTIESEKHSSELEKLRAENTSLLTTSDENKSLTAQLEEIRKELKLVQNQEPDTSKLDAEIEDLKSQLNKAPSRQTEADQLAAEISTLKSRLSEAQKSATTTAGLEVQITTLKQELEAAKDEAATASARDAEISSLKVELEGAKEAQQKLAEKDAEITKLTAQVENLSAKQKSVSPTRQARTSSPVKSDVEKEELRLRLEALEKRHQAAKDNAKSKSAKQAEEHASQIAEQIKARENALAEARASLERLQVDLTGKQTEIEQLQSSHATELEKLQQQIAVHESEMVKVRDDVKSSETTKIELASSLNTIGELQKTVENLRSTQVTAEKSATDMLDAIKSEHAKELKQIEFELTTARAESEQREIKDSEKTSKAATEHDEKIQSIQTQLTAAQAEVERLTEAGEKAVSDEVTKLNEELQRINEELNSARTNHTSTVEQLQAALETAGRDAKSLRTELEIKIAQLIEDGENRSRSAESSRNNLETQLDAARNEARELQAAVDAAKSGHSDEVASTMAKLKESHKKETVTLKADHAKRLKQLEEEGRASMIGLDELEKSHSARIAELEAQALSARETALAERSEVHAKELGEVSTKYASLREELEALKAAYNEEKQEFHTRHDARIAELNNSHEAKLAETETNNVRDKDAELKKLQDQHAAKRADLESVLKGVSEQDLAGLQDSHAEKVRQLESQNQDLFSQVEGTRFQMQTLKGILADMDRQSEEKQKEHEKELQFEKDQFSKAVIKISNHGSQLAEKDAAHMNALNDVRAEMRDTHERALIALEEDHSHALEALAKKLEIENKTLQDDMTAEHERTIELLKQNTGAKELDFEKLTAEHADSLATNKELIERNHSELVEELKMEQASQLAALRTELEETHTSALREANDAHQTLLANLQTETESTKASLLKEHEESLAQIKAELQRSKSLALDEASKADIAKTSLAETRLAVVDMRKEHEEVLQKANNEREAALKEAEETRNMRAVHEEGLEKARNEHVTTLKAVNVAHDEAVSKLQSEVAELKIAAKKITDDASANAIPVRDLAVENELKSELAKAGSRIENMARDHSKSWSEAKAQHAKALKMMREELENVRQEMVNRPDQTIELEALKKRNEELVQQHSFLADEAERQSRRADLAEKEIRDLRKAAKAASVTASSPVLSTKLKSNNSSAVSSPKASSGGLQSSRWAGAEKSLDPQAAIFYSAGGPPTVGLGLHNGTDANSESGQSKARSERNVHGQLAGINEDIRALNNLSEQMLAENRRMAKTLSRVDDETGQLDTVTVDEQE